MLNLTEIKAACEKATKGPWRSERLTDRFVFSGNKQVVHWSYWTQEQDADAHFIANSRQWVPELIAEVERLQAFIINVKNSSTCPATVLVAGQVLRGHDVRKKEEESTNG